MELTLEGLTKQYGQRIALKDLNASLGPGIYGILGPNGAGKSTLMNLLTDNIRSTKGRILYDGEDIVKMGERFRGKVGYMPQQCGMYEDFTILHFLKYMAGIKELPGKESKAQTQELLELVGLTQRAHQKIRSLSGGMKQRVMLAQALLGDPKVLILDEPTAGLDPEERIRIRSHISQISRDRIILFATHVVSDIESIADEVLLLMNGELIGRDTPGHLIEGIRGKVAEGVCCPEEVDAYRRKYCVSNLFHHPEGICLRLVGDELPADFTRDVTNIGLEEVYLYYLRK